MYCMVYMVPAGGQALFITRVRKIWFLPLPPKISAYCGSVGGVSGMKPPGCINWIINNREVIMTCIFQWPHPTPDVHAPTLARMHTVQCLTYELLQHAKLSSTRTAENSILFKARSEASL